MVAFGYYTRNAKVEELAPRIRDSASTTCRKGPFQRDALYARREERTLPLPAIKTDPYFCSVIWGPFYQ